MTRKITILKYIFVVLYISILETMLNHNLRDTYDYLIIFVKINFFQITVSISKNRTLLTAKDLKLFTIG